MFGRHRLGAVHFRRGRRDRLASRWTAPAGRVGADAPITPGSPYGAFSIVIYVYHPDRPTMYDRIMTCTIIVGGFFGDEGKGKIVAHIAHQDRPTIIARGGVGPNAGHTVQVGDRQYGVRMVPSGFVFPDARLCIGAGVLVDPRVLIAEARPARRARPVLRGLPMRGHRRGAYRARQEVRASAGHDRLDRDGVRSGERGPRDAGRAAGS